MTNVATPCRTYIVYQHALFAQGVRSILEEQKGIQIVGMEKDIGKALKAVRSVRPEVILVEEPSTKNTQWRFLQLATTGRVVTLSLGHTFATVYDQHHVPTADPADLVQAIRGVGKRRQPPVPAEPQQRREAKGNRRDAGPDGDKGQGERAARVRHARKLLQAHDIPCAPRARKGG